MYSDSKMGMNLIKASAKDVEDCLEICSLVPREGEGAGDTPFAYAWIH